MNITVLTPDKEIFKGLIQSVRVPGTKGQFQVLSRHAPIVSSLTKGSVSILKADNARMQFEISGGFIEVLNNEVSLLVTGVVIN
jgi:F-type H+-transporting ATPase subunit epsilon